MEQYPAGATGATPRAPEPLRILLIGDVVGPAGMRALFLHLARLRKRRRCDLVIANVENAAAGFGLTLAQADELAGYGIDVMTSGNHIWQQREIWPRAGVGCSLVAPAQLPAVGARQGSVPAGGG